MPSFVLATNPPAEGGVAWWFHSNGIFAPRETVLFYHLLHERCRHDGSSKERPLVVDVGANLGYFTMYAATMGCDVIAFEPQPQIQAYLAASIALNQVADRVQVVPKVLSDHEGVVNMTISANWGRSHVSGVKAENEAAVGKGTVITLDATRLDAVVPLGRHVALLKIDTEGFEAPILRGALALFEQGRVDNVVLEVKATSEKEWKVEWLTAQARHFDVLTYHEDYSATASVRRWSIDEIPREHYKPGQWPTYEDVWLHRKNRVGS